MTCKILSPLSDFRQCEDVVGLVTPKHIGVRYAQINIYPINLRKILTN